MRVARPRPLVCSCVVLVFLAAFLPGAARAELSLPRVFGDHMVLQQGCPVPIWGTAAPGAQVTVSFTGQTHSTLAAKDGTWRVTLDPINASPTGRVLSVRSVNGKSQIENRTCMDVLVGEVWLCAGQSNMWWPLRSAANARQALPKASHPGLRLLNLAPAKPPGGRPFSSDVLERLNPRDFYTGTWQLSSPESAKSFSAVGYFFGRTLVEALNMPVGLIHNAVGGVPTEAYVSRDALAKDPALRPLTEGDWFKNALVHPWCRRRARLNLSNWFKNPAEPRPRHPFETSFMFDAGIAPLIPFAIRGAVWYQGESNAPTPQDPIPFDPAFHARLFRTLITDWRKRWGYDFPFLYVQLPSMGRDWMAFREVQRAALAIPNTGMAVTIDIGHPTNVHPTNKRDVGRRLALWALAKSYGRDIVYSGPLLRAMTVRGDEAVLAFDHVGGGLATSDGGPPATFEVAGADGTFRPATARIEGGTVVVASPKVRPPVHVRYAWASVPTCNLTNREGLPASPFTTEDILKR